MDVQEDSKTRSSKINVMPGFRFHPTEQELVGFYLRRMVEGKGNAHDFIPKVELYRYDPWELPDIAPQTREKERFFFVPRDSKFPNGGRPNRRTKSGYWKATGTDRTVQAGFEDPADCVGLKKTLVYYEGRAPNGTKTNWIMNEYRLSYGDCSLEATKETLQSSITLCRIYRKDVPLRLAGSSHVETEAEKSFQRSASAETAWTTECCKLEDYSPLPLPSRRFPAVHENTPMPASLKSQRLSSFPQNCLSCTSIYPESNQGAAATGQQQAQSLAFLEQKLKSRGHTQLSSAQATPSSSCISTSSYTACGMPEHHVNHVVESKAPVLVPNDPARGLDTALSGADVFDMKYLQEIEPWSYLNPLKECFLYRNSMNGVAYSHDEP